MLLCGLPGHWLEVPYHIWGRINKLSVLDLSLLKNSIPVLHVIALRGGASSASHWFSLVCCPLSPFSEGSLELRLEVSDTCHLDTHWAMCVWAILLYQYDTCFIRYWVPRIHITKKHIPEAIPLACSPLSFCFWGTVWHTSPSKCGFLKPVVSKKVLRMLPNGLLTKCWEGVRWSRRKST